MTLAPQAAAAGAVIRAPSPMSYRDGMIWLRSWWSPIRPNQRCRIFDYERYIM